MLSKKKKKKNSKAFKKKFQKRFFTNSSVAVLIIGLSVFAVAGMAAVSQRKQAEVYDQQIRELHSEIRGIESENKRLEEEKANLGTDAFKEKIAREILGMIGKDEYILKEDTEAAKGSVSREEDSKEEPSGGKSDEKEKSDDGEE